MSRARAKRTMVERRGSLTARQADLPRSGGDRTRLRGPPATSARRLETASGSQRSAHGRRRPGWSAERANSSRAKDSRVGYRWLPAGSSREAAGSRATAPPALGRDVRGGYGDEEEPREEDGGDEGDEGGGAWIFIGTVGLIVAAPLYFTGTGPFEEETCIQNAFGAEFCGQDAVDYCNDLKADLREQSRGRKAPAPGPAGTRPAARGGPRSG